MVGVSPAAQPRVSNPQPAGLWPSSSAHVVELDGYAWVAVWAAVREEAIGEARSDGEASVASGTGRVTHRSPNDALWHRRRMVGRKHAGSNAIASYMDATGASAKGTVG